MDEFFTNWSMNDKPKVLLADDSMANRVQLKQLLSRLDINIIEAASGREAIKLVTQYEFGAILLDVNMPDINGFETASAIASEGFTTHTPIIFLSGVTIDQNQIFKGYEMGAVDYIQWMDIPNILPAKLNFYLNYYKQKKELESANQTKSEFLSNMSHELRTPLNSILVLAQLLGDDSESNLNDKQLKFANTIYSSGTDLLNLINEILDLSKVESGMMEFVIDDVQISSFIEDIERKITHTASNKGLRLEIELAPNLPDIIKVDGMRVGQILNNLLSNAIKFTSTGTVTLRVFEPCESIRISNHYLIPGQSIAFAVADTGIGVSDDKKNLIFEAFRQADGSIRRRYGGTGLGLSISKKLAAKMGGELIFQSQQNKGSTFVLYLPQKPHPAADLKKQLESELPISQYKNPALKLQNTGETLPPEMTMELKGKRALLVEDDIVNVYVMLSLLEKVHIDVVVASNGKEALEKIGQEKINLILMDMMMPEMDGFDATRSIKKIPNYRDIPIIAVTARAMKSDKEKCFKAGVDGYITKPVLGTVLFSEIYRCIK